MTDISKACRQWQNIKTPTKGYNYIAHITVQIQNNPITELEDIEY